jgi:hypothetical protein
MKFKLMMFTPYKYQNFVILLSLLLIDSISCFPSLAKVKLRGTADVLRPQSHYLESNHQGFNVLDEDALCEIVRKLTLYDYRAFCKEYTRASICLRQNTVMIDILVNTYGYKHGIFEALNMKINLASESDTLVDPSSNIETINLLCDRNVENIQESMLTLRQIQLLNIVNNNNKEVIRFVLNNVKERLTVDDKVKMMGYALLDEHIDTAELIRSTLEIDIRIANDELMAYYSYNSVDTIKYLQSKGANIHAQDDNALFLASNYRKIESIRYLMEQGIVVRFDMLVNPCSYGDLNTTKLLLHGVDKKHIDLLSLLNIAKRANQKKILKFLLKWGGWKTRLRWRMRKAMRSR